MGNGNILKLGLGLKSDLKKLQKEFGAPTSEKKVVFGQGKLVDLDDSGSDGFFKSISSNTNDSYDGPNGGSVCRNYLDSALCFKHSFGEKKCSLEYQVRTILERKLSKFEQISDWDTRPLRKSQMHYAGMDAWVLIKLYEAMQKKAEDKGFELVCDFDNFMF